MADETTYQVLDLDVRLETQEVLRLIGCRQDEPLSSKSRDLVAKLVAEARKLVEPRGGYLLRPVERMSESELVLKGMRTVRGPVAGFLRPATRVAPFLVTIGPKVEELVCRYREAGDKVEANTLNAIGSAAIDLTIEALADTIYFEEATPEEALTPPISPGYCGLPIEEQITLFSVLPSKLLRVKLLPDMSLEPVKSASGLMGIGPSAEVEEHGVPCEWCHLKLCQGRDAGERGMSGGSGCC
jgi:hypothetical protein